MNCYSTFASYFPTDFWKSCLALSPGALLWISSDEDDPRIFLVGKFGNFFFWVGGDFFGYSKQSEDLLPLCCRVVLQIKFNQLQTWAHKFVVGFLGELIFGPGIFGVLIFAPIQSSPSLEIWSTPWGFMSQTRQTRHYVREMREKKSKAPCHVLCVKCPIHLTWPIKWLSCRLAISFSFFNIYFSIDVDKYKDISPWWTSSLFLFPF